MLNEDPNATAEQKIEAQKAVEAARGWRNYYREVNIKKLEKEYENFEVYKTIRIKDQTRRIFLYTISYKVDTELLLAYSNWENARVALQDAQATEWRDVAIGEIPEVIVYRDPRGTFTRSVTITFVTAVIIMLLVRGKTSLAVPYYGVGVFLPIMAMALAIRKHILQHYTGRKRAWGSRGAGVAAGLALAPLASSSAPAFSDWSYTSRVAPASLALPCRST